MTFKHVVIHIRQSLTESYRTYAPMYICQRLNFYKVLVELKLSVYLLPKTFKLFGVEIYWL